MKVIVVTGVLVEMIVVTSVTVKVSGDVSDGGGNSGNE